MNYCNGHCKIDPITVMSKAINLIELLSRKLKFYEEIVAITVWIPTKKPYTRAAL